MSQTKLQDWRPWPWGNRQLQSEHVAAQTPNRVYAINEVTLRQIQSNPPTLLISVVGSVTSTGWTGAQLSRWYSFAPPADGIYDFDLNALPPSGPANDVISPISVAAIYPEPPHILKGVRVHATTNSLVALLSDSAKIEFADADKKLDSDGHAPW